MCVEMVYEGGSGIATSSKIAASLTGHMCRNMWAIQLTLGILCRSKSRGRWETGIIFDGGIPGFSLVFCCRLLARYVPGLRKTLTFTSSARCQLCSLLTLSEYRIQFGM